MSRQMTELIETNKLTLTQEDFIDWILKHTDDVTAEFHIWETKDYITVNIAKTGWPK